MRLKKKRIKLAAEKVGMHIWCTSIIMSINENDSHNMFLKQFRNVYRCLWQTTCNITTHFFRSVSRPEEKGIRSVEVPRRLCGYD